MIKTTLFIQKSLLHMIQQWFDSPHSMAHHSSISSLTQCKYSLLHHSHGATKPLPLHFCLVPQGSLLPTFTMSNHPQVTPCLESTLSSQLKTISSISWLLFEYLHVYQPYDKLMFPLIRHYLIKHFNNSFTIPQNNSYLFYS